MIVSRTENAKIKLDNFTITNSKDEKLLGIIFDDKLKFQYHIENMCKKSSLKLSGLSRVALICHKKKKISNAFFQLQFSYCTLVWMCHSRTLNNKINRFHERCLRLTYNDKHSIFKNVLKRLFRFYSYSKLVISCHGNV